MFARHGFKESSGSEDEAGKPERAMARFEEVLRKDEQAETAKAMGLVPVPSTETLEWTRRRFKGTLDSETEKRVQAEAAADRATKKSVAYKRKYEDTKNELQSKIDKLNKKALASAATASAPRSSDGKIKRRGQLLVHPDRIPAHLRNSPSVQEYSTSLSQGVDKFF